MARFNVVACRLGMTSVWRALAFGVGCAALSALATTLVVSRLRVEVENGRKVIGIGVHSNAGLVGEIVLDPIPLHLRSDYRPQSPDVLLIELSGPGALAPEWAGVCQELLVEADGTLNLGDRFGKVSVAGLTLPEIEAEIERRIDMRKSKSRVHVSVAAQNSKVYYLIVEGGEDGDMVYRFPSSGNDTVLDALRQLEGFSEFPSKRIWIARPRAGSNADTILPIDWNLSKEKIAITKNHVVLPGDRIFVAESSSFTAASLKPSPTAPPYYTN